MPALHVRGDVQAGFNKMGSDCSVTSTRSASLCSAWEETRASAGHLSLCYLFLAELSTGHTGSIQSCHMCSDRPVSPFSLFVATLVFLLEIVLFLHFLRVQLFNFYFL